MAIRRFGSATGKMKLTEQRILTATLVLAIAASSRNAVAQTASSAVQQQSASTKGAASPSASLTPESLPLGSLESSLFLPPSEASFASQPLFDFNESDIKFKLGSLMNTLRDSRHESWVLAAYPDPKTSRPLIGAGFSLDVKATEHPQNDPLNPHIFLEPSSAQLWQAAGLDSERLQLILDRYDRDLKAWKKKNFRRKIKTHQLAPEVTNEEATSLLQISTIQAVHNARAYCREFDQLTATQQMALSQLVFQMGVNLEEFVQFLGAINDLSYRDTGQRGTATEAEAQHWKAVQSALIQSQWAKRYTTRAVSVIAMFDPSYDRNPKAAEHTVQATLRPPARHSKKSHVKSVRAGSDVSKAPQTRTPG
jgi:Phage lysozyme